MIPRLYLGTMTFAWSQTSSVVDQDVAAQMVERFLQTNHDPINDHCIDTARIYAGGQTEACLGAVLSKISSDSNSISSNSISSNSMSSKNGKSRILVGSKAHPSQEGGLSALGIRQQLADSFQAMPVLDSKMHEYYLHQPDPSNSLLESLQCLDELVQQGAIAAVGMSNYHHLEMERAFQLCQTHNLTPPTVYQGLYNPLNRAVEKDLLPLLHRNNCAFVAYNPLAAGLLTGKHSHSRSRDDGPATAATITRATTATATSPDPIQAAPGRFANNPNYLPRFYTPSNFRAVAVLQAACDRENETRRHNNSTSTSTSTTNNTTAVLTLVEATYQWMLRHSALRPSVDGLLLGASSLEQLDQNLQACAVAATAAASSNDDDNDDNNNDEVLVEYPALSDDMLQAFEEAWQITKADGVFPYWRSYSSDMPGGESLDQGASYSAAKKQSGTQE